MTGLLPKIAWFYTVQADGHRWGGREVTVLAEIDGRYRCVLTDKLCRQLTLPVGRRSRLESHKFTAEELLCKETEI